MKVRIKIPAGETSKMVLSNTCLQLKTLKSLVGFEYEVLQNDKVLFGARMRTNHKMEDFLLLDCRQDSFFINKRYIYSLELKVKLDKVLEEEWELNLILKIILLQLL